MPTKAFLWPCRGTAIAALRKAGGHPLYTEYAGVGHNVWEWAYTEPELIKWVFSQSRA